MISYLKSPKYLTGREKHNPLVILYSPLVNTPMECNLSPLPKNQLFIWSVLI